MGAGAGMQTLEAGCWDAPGISDGPGVLLEGRGGGEARHPGADSREVRGVGKVKRTDGVTGFLVEACFWRWEMGVVGGCGCIHVYPCVS